MSLKGYFLNLFQPKKNETFLIPSFEVAQWTEKNKFELFTFMNTDTGKALYEFLRQNVVFTQISVCKSPTAEIAKAMGIAQGKEMLLSQILDMFKTPEEKEKEFMDTPFLNGVLNDRINGTIPEDVEL